ncbi:MAG: S9 family peptidase [Wenzhouxiangella sp.]
MRIQWKGWLMLAMMLGVASASAVELRPMTHEDMWLMPRVGTPVPAPSGDYALVQVTQPAYDSSDQASHYWLIRIDGSAEPRQLTHVPTAEFQADWSPDGQQIAFVTRRQGDDAPQVYLLDLRGGEARRLTSQEEGARHPRFSPDGRMIAYVSNIKPSADNGNGNSGNGPNVLTYTGFPIRNWNRWLDDSRPNLFVIPVEGGEARNLLADSALVQSPGFDGRRGAGSSELDAVWAPDGQSLIFVASDNRDRFAFDRTSNELWQVGLGGDEPQRLTGSAGEAGDSWGQPRFSADGQTLLALRIPATDWVYNAPRLVRLDWPTATVRDELSLPDRLAVNEFQIADDGRIFILSEDAGLVRLFQAAPDSRQARPVFERDRGIYTGLAYANGQLLARFESATEPAEVVRFDLDGSGHERLSHFTAEAVAGLDLAPVEHFWFESENGADIHSLLIKPANFDPNRRYPLLVLMHGGPHIMFRDYFFLRWNYHLLAGSDYVVLATNYTGSTGFGEDFARGIQGDPLRGPANEINQAADVAIERFDFIDGDRQCAGGASYGGHLANWMQASTDRYRCLISHAGLVNLKTQWGTSDAVFHREANMGGPFWELPEVWAEQNPIRFAENFSTPVLVTIGKRDERVPLANTLEYWTVLQRMQVESRLLVYPDEDHWIMNGHNSRHFYGEVSDWLARWLLD